MIRLYDDEIWQEKNFKFYLPNETIEVNGDGDSLQFSFHQKLLKLVKNNDFSIYFLYDHDFKPNEKEINNDCLQVFKNTSLSMKFDETKK